LGNWKYAARRAGIITGKFRAIQESPEEGAETKLPEPSVFFAEQIAGVLF
jgi:hypothetical protein